MNWFVLKISCTCTYNSITEDADGNPVTVIKGLKDTCELLSDPILNQLKSKMREFINKYKNDGDDSDFDYSLYEDAITQCVCEQSSFGHSFRCSQGLALLKCFEDLDSEW